MFNLKNIKKSLTVYNKRYTIHEQAIINAICYLKLEFYRNIWNI